MSAFAMAKEVMRPTRGWLRAIREGLGLTLAEVAGKMGTTKSTLSAIEHSEADDRINISTLKKAAAAMNCRLIYAIVPITGTLAETAENAARNQATERVHAVEHTMVLEDQATGEVEESINEETKRILERA